MIKKTTIRDVAKHAGVSVASVSYVLNNVNKVTAETKERILASIKELDYSPNLAAKSLSDGESKLIGVTLPITEQGDIPGTLLENNPFFGEFLSGIEYVTRSRGYDILISGIDTNTRYKDWIQRRWIEGLIMLGVYPRDILTDIKALNIPIVLTDAYGELAKSFHNVTVEDEVGAYSATMHLLSLGHRDIAIATGSIEHSPVNRFRYQGYVRALREAGLEPRPELFLEDSVSFSGGERIGARLLAAGLKASAVFATADIMALGIMKPLFEAGKKIPLDYSIIGFDNIKFSQYVMPGLTTINQDCIMKGRISAEMILEDLSSETLSTRSVTLQTQLIVRGTTAPFSKRND